MNIINRTLASLPIAILLGFGMVTLYLFAILFLITGRLPDVSDILNHLSDFEQIIEALKR